MATAAQALLLVTFPGAYALLLSFILGLGGLFAMIYGAAVAGSEWTWGTLKAAVARGESRSRYQLLSFASIGLMVGIGLLVAFAIGVAVAVVAANLAQVPTSGVTDADDPRHAARAPGSRLAGARRGMCARLRDRDARAQPARRDRRRDRASTSPRGSHRSSSPTSCNTCRSAPPTRWWRHRTAAPSAAVARPVALEPDVALLVVAAWLIGALVVAAVFTERAEISG